MEFVNLESISTKIDYGLTESASEQDTGNKFLRITDIRAGKINWGTVPFCQCRESDAKKYELQEGDIVFARTGSVGNTGLIRNDVPKGSVFASYLIRIRPQREIIDPEYLSYYFQTSDYWRQIDAGAVGAIQGGLNATKLGELKIPLPPLDEQKRIASLLARADRLRGLRRAARALGKSLLQGVFLEMFGDESKFDRVEFEEILQEDPKNGLYLPAEKYGAGTPIIRIDAFYNGILGNPQLFKRVDATEQQLKEFCVANEEILINRVNSIEYLGKCALVKGLVETTLFESNMMRIRINKKRANPVYVTKFLTTQNAYSQILQRAKKAVNQASINQQDVKSLVIPVPPLSLQEEFARVVARVEGLRGRMSVSERQVDGLFGSLLAESFGG